MERSGAHANTSVQQATKSSFTPEGLLFLLKKLSPLLSGLNFPAVGLPRVHPLRVRVSRPPGRRHLRSLHSRGQQGRSLSRSRQETTKLGKRKVEQTTKTFNKSVNPKWDFDYGVAHRD